MISVRPALFVLVGLVLPADRVLNTPDVLLATTSRVIDSPDISLATSSLQCVMRSFVISNIDGTMKSAKVRLFDHVERRIRGKCLKVLARNSEERGH